MSDTFSGVSIVCTTMTGSKKKTPQTKTPQTKKPPWKTLCRWLPPCCSSAHGRVIIACLPLTTAWELVRYVWTYPPPYYYGQILLDSSGKDLTAVKPQPPSPSAGQGGLLFYASFSDTAPLTEKLLLFTQFMAAAEVCAEKAALP